MPTPSPAQTQDATDTLVCAHCGEPIRRCVGHAELPKWGRPLPPGRCVFDGFVHAYGARLGSHLCGKGSRMATPANPGGWVR